MRRVRATHEPNFLTPNPTSTVQFAGSTGTWSVTADREDALISWHSALSSTIGQNFLRLRRACIFLTYAFRFIYARRAQPRLKTASLEIFILGLRSAVQLLCCSLRLCSSLFLCGIVWATVHIRGHGASMDVRVRHVCGCLVCRMHWRLAMDRSALAHQCCSARIPLVFGVWASIRPRTHGSAQASGPQFSAKSVN